MKTLAFIAFIAVIVVLTAYNTAESLTDQTKVGVDQCHAAVEQDIRYQRWYDLKTISNLSQPPYWEYDGGVFQLHADLDGHSMVCLRFSIK